MTSHKICTAFENFISSFQKVLQNPDILWKFRIGFNCKTLYRFCFGIFLKIKLSLRFTAGIVSYKTIIIQTIVSVDTITVNENDIANDELKDVNFLRGVHNWWKEHHAEEIIRYNNKLYGRDVVAPLSFDISTFESREAWMELLVLGTAHCLGMRLEQHKGFIAFLRNRGYWDTYCRVEIDSDEWLDTLSDFLDKEDWNAEYAHWMKLFIRIYQFAKYLDKYVQVFEWWNDNPVENVLAIRTNSAYSGTGLDAPGLQKALGGRYNTGIHFVCREMVRRGVINTP